MFKRLMEEESKNIRLKEECEKMRYGYYKDKMNLTGYTETLEGKIKEFDQFSKTKDQSIKFGKKGASLMPKIRKPTMGNLMDANVVRSVHYFDQVDGMDLSEATIELLNSKIKYIADEYNGKLANLNKRNH
jgi:4-hydroxy-3-methylbut-2-en-1-yl diphosphate synthase IspG/GcpE